MSLPPKSFGQKRLFAAAAPPPALVKLDYFLDALGRQLDKAMITEVLSKLPAVTQPFIIWHPDQAALWRSTHGDFSFFMRQAFRAKLDAQLPPAQVLIEVGSKLGMIDKLATPWQTVGPNAPAGADVVDAAGAGVSYRLIDEALRRLKTPSTVLLSHTVQNHAFAEMVGGVKPAPNYMGVIWLLDEGMPQNQITASDGFNVVTIINLHVPDLTPKQWECPRHMIPENGGRGFMNDAGRETCELCGWGKPKTAGA